MLRDYNSPHTGRAELVCRLDKLVARAAILAIIEYSRLLLLHHTFELRGSAAFRSTQQPNSCSKMLFTSIATFTRVWPCFSYYVLAWSYYGKSLHQLQWTYILYFSCFTICFCHKQLILPSAKQRRLQHYSYKPGSSSSQQARAL